MGYKSRKYLVDLMFDGADENGRPFGVYVKNVGGRVFDYEIYGRFIEGSRFMKNDDYDYRHGPELEPIYAEWERQRDIFFAEIAAERAKEESYCLEMGDTGFEPVTSRV
jgi:hypothetical protein